MGNKNSHVDKEQIEEKINFQKNINEFLNGDKPTYNYITDFRKDKIKELVRIKKKIFHEKSNLKEQLNSKGLTEMSLEIFSSLVTTSVNHEVNSTLYKAVTIPKISDNNMLSVNEFDIELLGNQSAYLIDWIYKTFLADKVNKFDNWVPLNDEKFTLDNLEERYSSIQKDDEEEYSDMLDKNELSLEKEIVGAAGVNKKSHNKNVKGKNGNTNTNTNSNVKSGNKRPSTVNANIVNLVNNVNNAAANASPHTPHTPRDRNNPNTNFNPNSNSTRKRNNPSNNKDKSPGTDFDQKTVNSILNVMNKIQSPNSNKKENDTIGIIDNKKTSERADGNINNPPATNQVVTLPTFRGAERKGSNNLIRNDAICKPTQSIEEVNFSHPHHNNDNNTHSVNKDKNFLNSIKEKNLKVNVYDKADRTDRDHKANKIILNKITENEGSRSNTQHKKEKTATSHVNTNTYKSNNKNNGNKNEEPIKDKEKNFADLILLNVSPLKTRMKKGKLDFLDDDCCSEKEEKKIKGYMRPKGVVKEKEKVKINIKENKNSGREVPNPQLKDKTNRIRIDVRNLLEEIELDKNDSSKSSSIMVNLKDKSKSKSKSKDFFTRTVNGSKTAQNSNKQNPDTELNWMKKTSSINKKSGLLKSTLDILDNKTGFLVNNNDNNMNLNIHINSNNINNFNNFSSSQSQPQVDRRFTKSQNSDYNLKKKITFGGNNSKKDSVMNMNMNNNMNNNVDNIPISPKAYDFKQFIGDLELPKFDLDLSPLDPTNKITIPYNEVLKQLKENNKFLFEVTNEEKKLNEKIRAFNYGENVIKN